MLLNWKQNAVYSLRAQSKNYISVDFIILEYKQGQKGQWHTQ